MTPYGAPTQYHVFDVFLIWFGNRKAVDIHDEPVIILLPYQLGFASTLSVLPYKVDQTLQINQLEIFKLSNMLIECTFMSFKTVI